MIIIGEKINGSIPAVAKAIAERDADFIKARAISQEEAGATFIDCCASVPEEVEVETLKWMIDCIQEVSDHTQWKLSQSILGILGVKVYV